MRHRLIVLSLLLAATPARAQKLWRITDIITPPWSTTPVSQAAEALRGSGIALLDGAVKGPLPLACASAHIGDKDIAWTDLFGGAIDSSRRGELATRLNLLVGNGAYAKHVVCPGRVFDYVYAGEKRLLLFDGALLVLETPYDEAQIKDVDDWVKPLHPGFDCARARTTPERLACADYPLSLADRKMSEAYARLQATVSPASFATIRIAQRGWLPYVAALCKGDGAMPEAWTERRDIADCLRSEADAHASLLDEPVLTAGPLRLEPRMHAIYADTPPREDAIIYPFLSGPGADAFNQAVEARTHRDAPFLTPDRMADPDFDGAVYARRSYVVAAATPRLISLTLVEDYYAGGAHGALHSESLNYDPTGTRLITLDDIFRHGSGWENFVTRLCLEDFRDNGPNDVEAGAAAAVVANPMAWTFDRVSAHVFFDVYTITSYSGGAHEEIFPYRRLRPYLRPDAKLP